MEKMQTLPQIREVLMDRARALQELSDQALYVEKQIVKIAGQLTRIENTLNDKNAALSKERPFFGERKSNIIPFPVRNVAPAGRGSSQFGYLVPILARPGEALPYTIPDFRGMLQRDGLILLSWAKKHTEMGERYTAYWVTSQGINRYYASADLDASHFTSAIPVSKSYAAEDGIEFYGQNSPAYIVHVAPELMMSRRQAEDQRPEHIKKLQALGTGADYNYHFLLTKKRKRAALRKKEKILPRESRA
jgi:hypothetical protein